MREKRKLKNWGISQIVFSCFLWIYALVSLYPMFWMILYSLKDNAEIFVTNPFGLPKVYRFENYVNAWNKYNVPLYFLNSVIVAIGTVFLTLVIALLFSYATARLQWKGRTFVRLFISLGMFIPVQAILIPIVRTNQNLHLMGTRLSMILPYAALNLAFACMVYYGFFRGIPIELEEAACMDGATVFQSFFRIICPLVKPATVTLVIYIFLSSWNEFILANVLVGSIARLKTLPLGVLFFQGQFTTDWGGMGATMVIASLPAVAVYVLFSEQVEHAMTIGGAVKG